MCIKNMPLKVFLKYKLYLFVCKFVLAPQKSRTARRLAAKCI